VRFSMVDLPLSEVTVACRLFALTCPTRAATSRSLTRERRPIRATRRYLKNYDTMRYIRFALVHRGFPRIGLRQLLRPRATVRACAHEARSKDLACACEARRTMDRMDLARTLFPVLGVL
jgi:hypothetical protein